jgi:LacI family transcriptional regulator
VKPRAQITLQDIADELGLSRSAVSYALRGQPNIPEETRARVREAAARLGYRPNPMVSALMSYQRATRSPQRPVSLAFVADFSRKSDWHLYFSENLLPGIESRAAFHGYKVDNFWTRDGLGIERLNRAIYQRNIPGVIVAPLRSAHGHLRLEWQQFASVTIGYSLARPEIHRVITHHFRGMRQIIRELRRKGYRRLGLAIIESHDSRVENQWSAAFDMKGQGIDASKFIVKPESWGAARFTEWFFTHRPEVIIGSDPLVIGWLRKVGYRVPKNVGFVNLYCADPDGEYAGLYHNAAAIGGVAVDAVVSMIHRNERGIPERPQTILLHPKWVEGRTLLDKVTVR